MFYNCKSQHQVLHIHISILAPTYILHICNQSAETPLPPLLPSSSLPRGWRAAPPRLPANWL